MTVRLALFGLHLNTLFPAIVFFTSPYTSISLWKNWLTITKKLQTKYILNLVMTLLLTLTYLYIGYNTQTACVHVQQITAVSDWKRTHDYVTGLKCSGFKVVMVTLAGKCWHGYNRQDIALTPVDHSVLCHQRFIYYSSLIFNLMQSVYSTLIIQFYQHRIYNTLSPLLFFDVNLMWNPPH